MQRNEIVHLLRIIATEYETFTIDEDRIELWSAVLLDVDLEGAKRSLAFHLRDAERGRFAPKPADLIGKMPARLEAGANLDAAAYKRYAAIRSKYQAGGEWTAADDREYEAASFAVGAPIARSGRPALPALEG